MAEPKPDATPDPTVGRIVHYTLTDQDVARIANDREQATGYGNVPHAGDLVPLIVVRVWDGRLVNGQVLLDGNDRLWVTSRAEGDDAGQWHYPVIVSA